VASLSQGRTAAAQCGLFTHKSVPVIFEPPCTRTCHINSDFVKAQKRKTVFAKYFSQNQPAFRPALGPPRNWFFFGVRSVRIRFLD